MALSRDDILKANDLKTEGVEVPEWGGKVFVRSITAAEHQTFSESLNPSGAEKQEDMSLSNVKAKLVVFTAVDADGNLLFKPEDAEALGAKSAKAVDRVYVVASRLNGIEGAEETIKNSETAQGDDSP